MSQDINLTKHLNKILIDAMPGLNRMLVEVKKDVDENTPEDTRTLLEDTRIIEATLEGDRIVGKVVNDTEYNQYIEYGVSENRNYHKPKGTIFIPNAQGARMFTKAGMKLQENFNSIKNV